MRTEAESVIKELLVGAARDVDLPDELYQRALGAYDGLSSALARDLGDVGEWRIYTQGSIRLGTVVRPAPADDFDLDAVAQLEAEQDDIAQADLKALVGGSLKRYLGSDDAEQLGVTRLDEWDRCWTLSYANQFHFDMLPAVTDPEAHPTGIWVPDRKLNFWQPGDPIGFAEWFFARMRAEFDRRRVELAKQASVQVDEVPSWQVRTALQRAIQVLKLHRNQFFAKQLDLRPSSIIVTTTAAQSYNGTASVVDTLMNAAQSMAGQILRDGGRYVVPNPVRSDENFAESWDDADVRRFVEWLDDVQRTVDEAAQVTSGMDQMVARMEQGFGVSVRKSAQRMAQSRTVSRTAGHLSIGATGLIGARGMAVPRHTFHGD
jgi:hypothetical protein